MISDRPAVGERVVLCGSHPHAGSRAFVVAYREVPGLPHLGERPVVCLPSGRECYVARDEELRPLEER